ncbi:hypothetical protein COP2_024259 [Malus domestica]
MLALLRCTSVSLWKGPLSMFIFEEQENYQSDIFAVVDASSSYSNRLNFSPQVPAAPLILVAQSGAANFSHISRRSRSSHTLPPPSSAFDEMQRRIDVIVFST